MSAQKTPIPPKISIKTLFRITIWLAHFQIYGTNSYKPTGRKGIVTEKTALRSRCHSNTTLWGKG